MRCDGVFSGLHKFVKAEEPSPQPSPGLPGEGEGEADSAPSLRLLRHHIHRRVHGLQWLGHIAGERDDVRGRRELPQC